MKDKSDHRRQPRAQPRQKPNQQETERRRHIPRRSKVGVLAMIVDRLVRRQLCGRPVSLAGLPADTYAAQSERACLVASISLYYIFGATGRFSTGKSSIWVEAFRKAGKQSVIHTHSVHELF